MVEVAENATVAAAADIGSNATKILLWEIAGDGRARERFQKRYPLRLDDVFRTGQIEPATIARLIETFLDIADIVRKNGARQVRAVATEAFRSASNARAVVEAIALETGIEPEVISPQEEGRLVASGVLLDHPEQRNSFMILDIGGGSAQITRPIRDGAIRTTSVPLGAVRLREMFIHSDPIRPADFGAMSEHVEATLRRGATGIEYRGSGGAFGCGGGVRFLHTMCGILHGALSQDQAIRVAQVEHLRDAIWAMTSDSLARHYGIDHERAEIIVPGVVVLLGLMKHLKIRQLQPSSRGVRDGLLAEFMKSER